MRISGNADRSRLVDAAAVQEPACQIHGFEQAAARLFAFPGNLLRFATCSLPVLPGFVLTDRGIVDGKRQKLLSCE